MKSEKDFDSRTDYRDYLTAYYAGQAMAALIVAGKYDGISAFDVTDDAMRFARTLTFDVLA